MEPNNKEKFEASSYFKSYLILYLFITVVKMSKVTYRRRVYSGWQFQRVKVADARVPGLASGKEAEFTS